MSKNRDTETEQLWLFESQNRWHRLKKDDLSRRRMLFRFVNEANTGRGRVWCCHPLSSAQSIISNISHRRKSACWFKKHYPRHPSQPVGSGVGCLQILTNMLVVVVNDQSCEPEVVQGSNLKQRFMNCKASRLPFSSLLYYSESHLNLT